MSRPSSSIRGVRPNTPLMEIQEVASVDRELVDLFRSQDALYGGLFGIHRDGRSLNFDDLVHVADLELDVTRSGNRSLHRDQLLGSAEALGFDPDQVIAGEKTA